MTYRALNELIDIVTEDGLPTEKTALKTIIHKEGYLHNTAHIWFYTKQGEILLQQRSVSKKIHPLLWDVSVAGHIDSGETIESGGIREIKEEIGISVYKNGLKKIGVFKNYKCYPNGIIDNELHHTFIAELKTPLSELKPLKDEVEALKLVTIPAFFELLKHSETNLHFIASNKNYYEKVINAIKKEIE